MLFKMQYECTNCCERYSYTIDLIEHEKYIFKLLTNKVALNVTSYLLILKTLQNLIL